MDTLPTIEITADQLQSRIDRVNSGDSPEQVSRTLGGEPYKAERKEQKRVFFWRFRLLDAGTPRDQYEIYMGEFENDLFVFGSLLPQG